MKRSVLVVTVAVLAMLLTTAGLSARQTVVCDDIEVGVDTQIGRQCPVMLTGSMQVRTDLIKPEKGTTKLFEQHVTMQDVEGIQAGGRTFQLVGADHAEGEAVHVITNCTEEPCPPPVERVITITLFTLVEQDGQGRYPVCLKIRIDFTGDEVTSRSFAFMAEGLCP